MRSGEFAAMNQKLTLALALLAGFAGGALSHYIAPAVVHAQTQPPKEIRAQSFILVAPDGAILGTFSNDSHTRLDGKLTANPMIKLFDEKGREIWSAGGSPLRPLSQR